MDNYILYMKNIFIRNNLGFREGNIMNYLVSFVSDNFVLVYLSLVFFLVFGSNLLLRVKKNDEKNEELNVYEFALLRQGTKAVIEVALFSLLEHGKISISGKDIRVLSESEIEDEVEKAVIKEIKELKKSENLLKSKELKETVKKLMTDSINKLEKMNFIEDEGQRTKRKQIFIGVMSLMALIILSTLIFRETNGGPLLGPLAVSLLGIVSIRGLFGADIEKTNVGNDYLIDRIKHEKRVWKKIENLNQDKKIEVCSMIGTRFFMEERILDIYDDWVYGPYYAWIFTK